MTVTVKVMSIDKDKKTVTVEAYCDKGGFKIMKSPIKHKQQSKKSIESVLRKELNIFNKPVWGGFCIHFYCSVD